MKATLFFQFQTLGDGAFKFSIMHPFELHPEFYNKPILLKDKELANSILVTQRFFEDYHLLEVRKPRYRLLEVTITRINDF